MKFPWAKLTLALITICNGPAVPHQARAQNVAPGPWTASAQAVGKQNPVAASEGSIAEGKAFFQQECEICHGSTGKGDGRKADTLKVSPANLSNPRMWDQSDGALFWKINEGRTPMPSFHPKLSTHEVWVLVNYVRTLGPRNPGDPFAATKPSASQTAPEPEKRQNGNEHLAAELSGTNARQKHPAWTVPSGVDGAKNPVASIESSIAEGNALYQQECLICHGPAGEGDGHKAQTLDVNPADLSNAKMREQTDGALFWKINAGNPPMPSFRLRFSRHEVWVLVNYVRTLASRDAVGLAAATKPQASQTASEPVKRPDRAEQAAAESGGTNSSQKSRTISDGVGDATEELPQGKARVTSGAREEGAGQFQPEYFHVLVNPLPIYGLVTAVLMLAGALVLRNRPAQLLALGLVVLSAASAWPTYMMGERAYTRVYVTADGDGQKWLDIHKHRAEKLIYVFYALAAVALCAALVPLKVPKTAFPLALLTLMMALASLGVGGWIGKAGGKIRHPEFRDEPSAQPGLAQAGGTQNPVVANESSIAVGKALFEQQCLACHGTSGKGDGPKADKLKVSPADLSTPEILKKSDGALSSTIVEGNAPMPSFRSKLSTQEVGALVNYIRTLGKALPPKEKP